MSTADPGKLVGGEATAGSRVCKDVLWEENPRCPGLLFLFSAPCGPVPTQWGGGGGPRRVRALPPRASLGCAGANGQCGHESLGCPSGRIAERLRGNATSCCHRRCSQVSATACCNVHGCGLDAPRGRGAVGWGSLLSCQLCRCGCAETPWPLPQHCNHPWSRRATASLIRGLWGCGHPGGGTEES